MQATGPAALWRCGLLALLLAPGGCHRASPEGAPVRTPDLQALTQADARAVWVRDLGDGEDMLLQGTAHALVGYDTLEGQERVLARMGDQIVKPLLTADGRHVVFSRRRDHRIFVVSWAGEEPREIGRGFALATWRDPSGGRDWVYAATDPSWHEDSPYQRVVRFALDEPSRSEFVWKGGEVSLDSVQVSRDGRRLGGMFPGPHGMIVDAVSGRAEDIARGCWTALAPDNSYLLWTLGDDYRNLFLHTSDGRHRWRVAVDRLPGGGRRGTVCHPRWSNHVRYLVLTGPYESDRLGRRVKGAGRGAEVWAGRFSPDLRRVEAWARLTENKTGDYYPDLWVAGGEASEVSPLAFPEGSVPAVLTPRLEHDWPGSREKLVFAWADDQASNTVDDAQGGRPIACAVEPRGRARFSRGFGMDIRAGAFTADTASAARVRAACAAAGEVAVEATITGRRRSLKGPARIVAFSAGPGRANFVLGQDGDDLVWRMRTSQVGRDGTAQDTQVRLARLDPGRPQHVVVTYRPGQLAGFVNGKPVALRQRIQGDLSTWDQAVLSFGDEPSGERAWDGEVEGVAIYHRFMGETEARWHYERYQARVGARGPARLLRVQAMPVSGAPAPDPATVAPAKRALALYVYELDPEMAAVDGSRFIQVYHWVLMDGRPVDDAPKPGVRYDLVLERAADHPELQRERLFQPEPNPGYPEFLDVSR